MRQNEKLTLAFCSAFLCASPIICGLLAFGDAPNYSVVRLVCFGISVGLSLGYLSMIALVLTKHRGGFEL